MGTTADKLNKVLESKEAIKAAIEAKGITDVGDILSTYPEKIMSIQTGGYTGHADVEGLRAIGWTDDDIDYYQKTGVNWNEEEDSIHKVPQDNIDLYGILTISNIRNYSNRIKYLPKIDLNTTNISDLFSQMNFIAIPSLDTSKVTGMNGTFRGCKLLTSIPILDTSNVTGMSNMFSGCTLLKSIPLLNTSKVTNMSSMFNGCSSLESIPLLDTSNVINMSNMFYGCTSLKTIPQLNTSLVTDMSKMFSYCSSMISIPPINVSNSNISGIIDECPSIETVQVNGLKTSLDIILSEFLKKESLIYIIENAAPTRLIYITLSEYCYEKFNGDPEVVSALSKQSNVSLTYYI